MGQSLFECLSKPVTKEAILARFEKNPGLFLEAAELVISIHSPQNWRSCWAIYHLMEDDDERLRSKIPDFIRAIPGKSDGHQRELIKVISKMELDEEEEGKMFDICINIWESPKLISSLRMTAFRLMMGTLSKYPQVVDELKYFVRPQYLDSLSPGIRNSVKKQFQQVKKSIKP